MNVTIIGAGLAGLSAARTLAQLNIPCCLVSVQASERAQSVLAEGGINAALDLMGENDSPAQHERDTLAGGRFLADPAAVKGLTGAAPGIVRELALLGVPFNRKGDTMLQRAFGGQKKKRTAYCKSSTGKALMTAMIDDVRRCETGSGPAQTGLVSRYPNHVLEELLLREDGRSCGGAVIRDLYSGEKIRLEGPVILAFGGPCGLFPGLTTGTTANDGNALAQVFSQGVSLANLEFIQYHPTTVKIAGKRLLISEAARGEGGRLFVMRGGQRWYFMEERYPELKNLMPRDVISAEMESVRRDPSCGSEIFLDLTGLSKEIWKKRLPDLREQAIRYLGIDPAKEPLPVSPGIHFFMGGIDVDQKHRTNLRNLYAAGECACQYHGANRLGGNSLLGAIYGGRVAAEAAAEDLRQAAQQKQTGAGTGDIADAAPKMPRSDGTEEKKQNAPSPAVTRQLCEILSGALGITRNEPELQEALRQLKKLRSELEADRGTDHSMDLKRIRLGEAFLMCAIARRESRGAHKRSDFPEQNDEQFRKTTVIRQTGTEEGGEFSLFFRDIPGTENK